MASVGPRFSRPNYPKLFDDWNLPNANKNTVWHIAVRNLTSDAFLDNISKHLELFNSWNLQNADNNTVWHLAAEGIVSYNFWNNISTHYNIMRSYYI